MNMDVAMVQRIQVELQKILQTSFEFAMKWGTMEQIFQDLWQKVQLMASQYKINLSQFVKLKVIAASNHTFDGHPQHRNQNPRQLSSQYDVSQSVPPHQVHQ